MKKVLLFLVVLSASFAQAQETNFEYQAREIAKKIKRITQIHKDSLKLTVKDINLKLDKEEITKTQAESLKKEAANYYAARIETLVDVEEQKLQLLVRDMANGKIVDNDYLYEESETFSIGNARVHISYDKEDYNNLKRHINKRKKRRYTRRNTTQFVFAMGANNVLNKHRLSYLDDSPYKFWKSRFYEVGFTNKYRLTEKAGKTYLKYGLSFLWNNLRPDNNQYHIVNQQGREELVVHPFDLKHSRLRFVQMTFPAHLEFDFSKDRFYDDGTYRDFRNKGLRIGLGGFVGFKMGTSQYLEYKDGSGAKLESIQRGSFNTNIYHYGVSAYVAHKSMGLYVKYDLNELFKNSDTRNISLGIRFDFD